MERLADVYVKAHGRYPDVDQVEPVRAGGGADGASGVVAGPTTGPVGEMRRLGAALRNNRQFLSAVLREPGAGEVLGDLSPAIFDPSGPILRDAWGTPIIFVPGEHPLLGMAPRNAPFFLSAGPDRRFLTRGDNLYSYDAFPHPD
jgi:hypothetical protein